MKRKEAIIVIIGILMRIAFYILVAALGISLIRSDAADYVGLGRTLLKTGKYMSGGKYMMLRPPLYSAILAVCMKLAGPFWQIAVIVLQMGAELGAFFALRSLLRTFLPRERYVFLGEVLFWLNFQSIFYAIQFLTDSLFQSGVIVLVWLLVSMFREKKDSKRAFWYAVIAGVLCGVLALLRAVMMYLPFAIFAGILFVFFWVKNKKNPREGIMLGGTYLILAMLPILLWSVRNYEKAGVFRFTTVTESNYYIYDAAAVEAELTGGDYYAIVERRMQELMDTKEPYHFRELPIYKETEKMMREHRGIYLKRCAMDLGAEVAYPSGITVFGTFPSFEKTVESCKGVLSGNTGTLSDKIGKCLNLLFRKNPLVGGMAILLIGEEVLLLLVFFGFLGWLFMKNVRQFWYEKWMLVGIAAYFMVCSCMPVGWGDYPRYRMPFFYIFVIGALAFYENIRKRRKGKTYGTH